MTTFTIKVQDFFDLATASTVSSTKADQPILNTVLFRAKAGNNELEAVATDSYRLVFIKRNVTSLFKEDFQFLMSTDDLKQLVTTIRGTQKLYVLESIVITVLAGSLTAAFGSATQKIDEFPGQFPKLDTIVPDFTGVGNGTADTFVVGFSLEFLASLLKVAGFEPNKKDRYRSNPTHKTSKIIYLGSASKPYVVLSQDGRTTAVLMLIRLG